MKAAYARQSVEKKNSVSIEGQIELCENTAGEKLKVYKDRGYSGKNTDRPGFQKLLKDIACQLLASARMEGHCSLCHSETESHVSRCLEVPTCVSGHHWRECRFYAVPSSSGNSANCGERLPVAI